MNKTEMYLWETANFLPTGDAGFEVTATTLGYPVLFKEIFNRSEGHISEYNKDGSVAKEEGTTIADKYTSYLESKGGRLVYQYLMKNGCSNIFLWAEGIVRLYVSGTWLQIHIISYDEKFVQEIRDYFGTQWVNPVKTGTVYAIVKNGSSLTLSSIGTAGITLEEGNYTPEVMKDYQYIIKDLHSASPSGRIVIMKGIPGTGKTHLVRDLLLQVPDAMFVLLSPDIVKNLAGPELLPLLLNNRYNSKGPIILVLEDADKCLVSRETDKEDISSIQAILNLGDGILGSLLDLRIVATTNASEFKMDPAILRPGRLSKMLDVTALDFETTCNIFRRLLPDAVFPEKLKQDNPHNRLKMTLAEVYALARQHGWTPEVKEVDSSDNEDEDE